MTDGAYNCPRTLRRPSATKTPLQGVVEVPLGPLYHCEGRLVGMMEQLLWFLPSFTHTTEPFRMQA